MLAVLISAVRPAWSESTTKSRLDPADLKNITLIKDVKAGMKGYGLSVFLGTKPEKFGVTVLGVLKKAYFGNDLILVKLNGGPMTKRGANLIEGMSGSPIYLNGKVAGAFAFGYPFGKEPIGMVTPIEFMLDAWDPTLPSKPSSFYPLSTMNLDEPIAANGHSYSKVAIDDGSMPVSADKDTMIFRPLSTPLMVSGMSERVMTSLRESLKPLNIRPVAGPGVASDKLKLSVDVQAGSSVGCSFVTGDVDMTGVGTVTYRRGDRILAFGHPMFSNPMMNGIGAINAPLSTAWVYDIYPSLEVSTKLAAPIKPIGTVFQDRPWAIAGRLGAGPADMIPVTVRVNDTMRGTARDFKVKVVNHPLLAMSFIPAAISEAIFEMRGNPGDCTALVKFEITAGEVGVIKRENTFFDALSIDSKVVGELGQILTTLQFNQFYPVAVKRVNVVVNLTPKHSTAKLDKVFVKEGKYKPGETIEISAVLKPFKGEPVTKTMSITLPMNMPNGRVSLEVMGGSLSRPPMSLSEQLQEMGGPPTLSTSSSTSMENLQQVIKKFLERDKNNDLVARIVLPKSVPSIAGEKFSNLPPSLTESMKSSKVTSLTVERDEIKTVSPTDWVISGSQRLSITVQKTDKSEKKTGSKKSSDSSLSASPDTAAPDEPPIDDSGDSSGFSAEMVSADTGTDAPIEITIPVAPDATATADKTTPADDAATTPDETTVTAPKPDSGSGTNEKPVGRTPTVWKQTSRTEFLTGIFKNTAATTADLLTTSPELKLLCDTGQVYVWCAVPDGKGNVYLGTGNKGIILKAAADGSTTVVYDSPELEIQSLALDSSGTLFAGTAPNGIIYRIAADGKAEKFFDADEKYITALAADGKGGVYAATGDKGKVYRIDSGGKASVVLDSQEYHALALLTDKDGNLFVGTGVNGIIYKVDANGKTTVLYDADEESVTSLAFGAKGVLYAGTSPKGMIYKLAADATPKAIFDKADKGVLGMTTDDAGNVYAMTAANIFKIDADDKVSTLENYKDLQFISMSVGGGTLYAGTGNVGSVYTADLASAEGTYESSVHDCGLTSKWGIIEWTADVPTGAAVVLKTRTGSVADPDASWSSWSEPYRESGTKISSPPGRYVQYSATLTSGGAGADPKLKDVSVMYLPANQAPKITVTAPKGGEKWAGKQTIKWTGSDPDKDTLKYKIYYSGDNGATWDQVADKIEKPKAAKDKKKLDATAPADTTEEAAAPPDAALDAEAGNPDQMLAEMAAELDKHPEIPQAVRDKILAEAPGDLAASVPAEPSAPADKPSPNGTTQTSLSWDTTKVKDGAYLLKIVGSDSVSNATDALTGESISELIIVCNHKPRIAAFKKTLTVQADKSVRVEGFAQQDLVSIAGVQYRVDTDEWAAAAADDGIFDSKFESFTVKTDVLTPGEHTLEVKAIDQAGNSTTVKLPVKIE